MAFGKSNIFVSQNFQM